MDFETQKRADAAAQLGRDLASGIIGLNPETKVTDLIDIFREDEADEPQRTMSTYSLNAARREIGALSQNGSADVTLGDLAQHLQRPGHLGRGIGTIRAAFLRGVLSVFKINS